MSRFIRYCFVLLLASIPAVVKAQPVPPIVTDRPDFTESGITVPVGSVQIEGGVTLSNANSESSFSGSELLIRWSPANRFEFRVAAPDYVIADGTATLADPSVGFKLQVGPLGPWDAAVIGVTSIPLGTDVSGLDTPEPGGIFAVGRDFGRFSLGTQISGFYDSVTEDLLGAATIVVGTGLSDKIGVFAELAGEQQAVGDPAVLLHSGLTFEPLPLVQLDFHAATGFTDAGPDILIGAGLSIRQ
ncbi:MAG: hypothetical protein HKN43_15460 [Rhodothermales bacterium]|nr:hypothetical protein [Rhodothermales bacterium]